MTDQQATDLAKRIINTMRPTPPLIEWVESLGPLDHAHALETFRQLRDSHATGLSCGAFHAAHRTRLERGTTRSHRRGDPDPDCERCDGTGWVDAPGETEIVQGERHTYTAVDTCPCTSQGRP